MNILITGGAGYIGSELVKFFIDEHKVTVIDNLMYDRGSLLRYAGHPNFKFVRGDIRNLNLFSNLLSNADVIIPSSSPCRLSFVRPIAP